VVPEELGRTVAVVATTTTDGAVPELLAISDAAGDGAGSDIAMDNGVFSGEGAGAGVGVGVDTGEQA
jgi:hypothetical protein